MVIVDTTSTQNTSSIIQQNSLKKTAKQNIKKKNKKIQALKKEEHCQSVPTLSSIFILSVNVRRI